MAKWGAPDVIRSWSGGALVRIRVAPRRGRNARPRRCLLLGDRREVSLRDAPTSPGAVLIADDHEVTRFGLGQLVRSELGATRVLEAERFEKALAYIGERGLGLAIVDLGMPGLPGPQALADFRRARPEVKVVVLSASSSREDILGCLAAGVHGYIIKTEGLDALVKRLRYVLDGEIYVPPGLAEPEAISDQFFPARPVVASSPTAESVGRLTPRQMSVLRCLEQGMTNKEIARELSITDRTVKMHLAAIYPLLGVHNRTQAAAVARDLPTGDSGSEDTGRQRAREPRRSGDSGE